jgi:glycerol-3-phosphate dehydrogenase
MNAVKFSAINRTSSLSDLEKETFDLLVIGGGITGCGIALDAASRGLKVALLEKNDFASGTSSKSTKLIHGGLRYLKQLEFGLVKEVGSERAVVHAIAPHLVIPEKMLLPLHEKKGLGYWLTSAGLKIYDWLAGVTPEDQRKMLTKAQTLKAEPLLKSDDVKGGALYAEYRTDDARLTIEIAKAAVGYGALFLNYVCAEEFLTDNKRVIGVTARDGFSGRTIEVRATVVVNAAGPWVDQIRTADQSLHGKRLHLTKGVHIVVPREKLPVKQAIYFDVEDGRMIFAIPRGRITYIGTTDTSYTGDKEEVCTTLDDARYLIEGVKFTFRDAHLRVEDIESSWAGLRPLIYEEGKSASELSRKDEIFESASGLISIAGGKLTGYRKMAERVVNLVAKKYFLSRDLKPCLTASIKLAGGAGHSADAIKQFRSDFRSKLDYAGIPAYMAEQLWENFGAQSMEIVDLFLSFGKDHPSELALIRAQLYYTLQHECVSTLADFFVRRTGLLYFDIHKVVNYNEAILEDMASFFSWDESRKQRERDVLVRLLRQAQLKSSSAQ